MEAETVTEGQNVLLTFKNIKGANFDKATKSAADLAVWMNKGSLEGANMAGASNMMGKALDNPTKGMTALAKVGVSFTDGEKAQIKALQAKGDMAGAQAIILKAVNGQVAGSSVAAGKTTEGMWKKISNSIGNVSEGILANVMPALLGLAAWFLKDGMPAIKGFGDWITANIMPALQGFGTYITGTVVPAFIGFGTWIVNNKDWLGALAITVGILVGAFILWQGALAAWTVITTAATAVQAAFNLIMSANPIALVVIAIAALVAGLVYFFTQTETGKAIWAGFTKFIGEAWANVSTWVKATWAKVSSAFSAGYEAVKGFLNQVWNVIKTVWNYSPYGLIINNWGKIMDFFRDIPNKIKGWFDGAIGWLKSAGGNVVEGLWRGISDGYNWIKGKIEGWVNNVIDFIKNALGIHSPSTVMAEMGHYMVKGLSNGIDKSASLATQSMARLANGLTGDFENSLAFDTVRAGGTVYVINGLEFQPANSQEQDLWDQFGSMLARQNKAGVK